MKAGALQEVEAITRPASVMSVTAERRMCGQKETREIVTLLRLAHVYRGSPSALHSSYLQHIVRHGYEG